MSDIFYTKVDTNLQAEINARAGAAKIRGNKQIDHMIGKVANVKLTPFAMNPGLDNNTRAETKKEITTGILGGYTVRSGSFLPTGTDGYLNESRIINKNTTTYAKRVPPYITSVDVSVGDHSMGLLNTATVNIMIPDPADLVKIEAIYFRPGRQIELTIEHPVSACILQTDLDSATLPSQEKIKALYPNVKYDDFKEKYGKIHKLTFEGLITSFNFNYQTDFSVVATLSMRGTSNIYTDVSLIIDSKEVKQSNPEKKDGSSKPKDDIVEPDKETFYTNLLTEFTNLKKEETTKLAKIQEKLPPEKKNGSKLKGIIHAKDDKTNHAWGIFGEPIPGAGEQQYITLAWLIKYINKVLLSKPRLTIPTAQIVFTEKENICRSTFYDDKLFVSTNPARILFSDVINRTYKQNGGNNLVWFGRLDKTKEVPNDILLEFKQDDAAMSFKSANNKSYYPTSILINLEVIKEIETALKTAKTFTLNALLEAISDEVYKASGHAFQLKLITHPSDQNVLLWYDCKYIDLSNNAEPFNIPIGSNNVFGQVARDFKFEGKLPSDASHLSYVMNTDTSQVSESDVAPFVAYMYMIAENESNPDENIKENAAKLKSEFEKKYAESYKTFKKSLEESIDKFANEQTDLTIAALQDALEKFIQYPTDTINGSNQVAAPVIPFDAEFTVDGINGFRYGDVLKFADILPPRYTNNTVFSVIGVQHTVGNDGIWTTSIRSIMRPSFSQVK